MEENKNKPGLHFEILWGDIKKAWIGILIVAVYMVIANLLFGVMCPQVLLIGIPCPGCGLTRGCLHIVSGSFAEAWQWNATAFLWLPYLVYLIFMRYIRGGKVKGGYTLLIIICGITIVYYIYRMICFYPNDEFLLHYYPVNWMAFLRNGMR